jgi:hypothetical protein
LSGGYLLRAAPSAPDVVLVAMGAVVAEAIAAADELARRAIAADVVCLTSADLVFGALQARRGRRDGDDGILDALFPSSRVAPIVTVLDGHPHTLSFLAGVHGAPIANLGVDDFGQSGDVADLYRHFGIDADAIVDAALRLAGDGARFATGSERHSAPRAEVEVSIDAALALRDELERIAAGPDDVPSLDDMIVKACALALRERPRVNASYRDARSQPQDHVNVGIAVNGRAFAVPILPDADVKSLGQIARESRRLAEQVGSQAAILGVDTLRAGVEHTLLTLTLTCDEKLLLDAAEAAGFLAHVRDTLEQPVTLAL